MPWGPRRISTRSTSANVARLAGSASTTPSTTVEMLCSIPAEKLSEAFRHIGGDDGLISKEDLARWLNDLHMDFMSERDFDRLWDAMDMDRRGVVEPLDFFAFLSECGPQFKEVHKEYSTLPKSERLKLALRRLSNISLMGEEGVEQLERQRNRRSRL